jgi:uncharacterized protein
LRIIDCHTHCFPDALAARAVARLVSGYRVTPSFDGTVTDLVRQMDDAGIEASVVVPVATKPSQVTSINDWVLGIHHPRVIPFGAIHPDFPEVGQEIERLGNAGIKGVKLHPNWQGYKPEEPRAFPVYEALTENGMIAFFHGGDELEKWPTPIDSTPKALAEVHDRYPDLKLVIAHMGGFRMWDDVERYLIGRDLYMDISFCMPEYLDTDRLVRMMRSHGIDKILYASDSPCGPPVPQLQHLLSLPLTDNEKSLVRAENAARLLGIQ